MQPSFGMLTNPSIEILKEMRTIRRIGFDYVEVGIEAPEGKPEILRRKRAEIMKLIDSFRTEPLGHTSPWIDLGSDYEHVRQGWIMESKRILDTADSLGLRLLNFHANAKGMFYGKKRKIILDNWVRSLQEIVSYARELEIAVMLENMPQSSSAIHRLDEFKYIVERVQGLEVHLDVPHAFTSGGMKSVLDYIRTFKGKIAHVHWHDNHGEFDEHLPIGDGLIDHRRAVEELKRIGYEQTITLEVFTGKRDAKRSAERLRGLWKKA